MMLLEALAHDLADLLGHVVHTGVKGLLFDRRVHLQLAEDVHGQAGCLLGVVGVDGGLDRANRPRTRL